MKNRYKLFIVSSETRLFPVILISLIISALNIEVENKSTVIKIIFLNIFKLFSSMKPCPTIDFNYF